MTASAVISPYSVRKKREAAQRSRETAQRQDQKSAMVDDDLAGAF
ncbi:hypothetical protein [Paraburkholderia saeva]|nr:hypothetical protein [Paraburkholderia saeva]